MSNYLHKTYFKEARKNSLQFSCSLGQPWSSCYRDASIVGLLVHTDNYLPIPDIMFKAVSSTPEREQRLPF